MRRWRERRSRESKLARALVALKAEADLSEDELERLHRWRFSRRAELAEEVDALRDQERDLVEALGGQPRGRGTRPD